MLLIRQNYKFESYLQPFTRIFIKRTDVVDTSKLQIWKLFTTVVERISFWHRCCWYVKITNLKAIYNAERFKSKLSIDVVDTSKLQIWKLFTTNRPPRQGSSLMLLIRQNYKFESYLQLLAARHKIRKWCCWYVKITNLKAIYNLTPSYRGTMPDVVDTSKLQIWKLFTTKRRSQ